MGLASLFAACDNDGIYGCGLNELPSNETPSETYENLSRGDEEDFPVPGIKKGRWSTTWTRES